MTGKKRTAEEEAIFKALAELHGDEQEQSEPDSHETIGTPHENPIDAAREGMPYAMTDLGNAERLVHWFGDRIRWDVARKSWRVWDGKRWKLDSEITVLELAGQSARKIKKEALEAPGARNGQADISALLWNHATKSESRDKLASCVTVAKSLYGVAIASAQWDSDKMLFNAKNGTIDLRTGKLKKHDRADLITRISNIHFAPATTCKRWDKFLSDSCGGNEELINYLQRVAGYCLSGDTSEEALWFIYGVGASGKTTFLETIKSMIGEYAETINPAMLCKSKFGAASGAATPELAALDGARLAAGSEIEAGKELDAALVKNVTGGESITARHLYAGIFTYRPQFKVILAMNDCPRASSEDTGLFRRIKRIEFNHAVPKEKRDKGLKPYLQGRGATAVLAWAVRGCMSWQKVGLSEPDAVEASTEAYKKESDPLTQWVEDCIEIDPRSWTSNADIQKNYKEYCEENGIKYLVSPKTIAKKLISLGCEQERFRTGRGWSGVDLKSDGWDENLGKDKNAKTPEKTHVGDTCDTCDRNNITFPNAGALRKSLIPSVTSVTSVTEPENQDEENDFLPL